MIKQSTLQNKTVIIIFILGVGCMSTSGMTKGDLMPLQNRQFVGNWEKITQSTCSQVYPDTIRFQPDGLYHGYTDPPGSYTHWDVGSFEIVDQKQVKISIANDAKITYEFSIINDVITFRDPDGCEYAYRRVS